MTLIDIGSALIGLYIAGFLSGSALGVFVRILGAFLR